MRNNMLKYHKISMQSLHLKNVLLSVKYHIIMSILRGNIISLEDNF